MRRMQEDRIAEREDHSSIVGSWKGGRPFLPWKGKVERYTGERIGGGGREGGRGLKRHVVIENSGYPSVMASSCNKAVCVH